MRVAAGHPHSAYLCPVPNLQKSNPHIFERHLISYGAWRRFCAWFDKLTMNLSKGEPRTASVQRDLA